MRFLPTIFLISSTARLQQYLQQFFQNIFLRKHSVGTNKIFGRYSYTNKIDETKIFKAHYILRIPRCVDTWHGTKTNSASWVELTKNRTVPRISLNEPLCIRNNDIWANSSLPGILRSSTRLRSTGCHLLAHLSEKHQCLQTSVHFSKKNFIK